MSVLTVDHEARRARRVARYEAQRVLWKVTKVQRLAYCGRVVTSRADGVTIRVTGAGTPDARAGFSGLQTCSSVWSCPVCSEKINAGRQSYLERAIEKWIADGNSILFATFTMRHSKGRMLKPLWDAIAPTWTKVISGTGWHGCTQRGVRYPGDKERFRIAGWARLVEVKHGEKNGWHPHIHSLMFVRGATLSDDELEQFRSNLFGRWNAELGRRGFSSLEFDKTGQAVAVDVRRVVDSEYIADYFAKNGYKPQGTSSKGAAYEVTGSHSKTAGKGGRTPFEILATLVGGEASRVNKKTGEVSEDWDEFQGDLALWHEWESTSGGRKQLTWSRGFIKELDLEPEKTDEEIVEEEALQGEPVSIIGTTKFRLKRGLRSPGPSVRRPLTELPQNGAWIQSPDRRHVVTSSQAGADHFGDCSQGLMLNFRVAGLDAMLAQLAQNGSHRNGKIRIGEIREMDGRGPLRLGQRPGRPSRRTLAACLT